MLIGVHLWFTLYLWASTGIDHLVEKGFDLFLKIMFHLIHVTKLYEGPAAILLEVIDARYPVGIHGAFLVFGILITVTLDFHNQI